MGRRDKSSLSPEGFVLLLEGSLSAIPFNIIVGLLLGLDFLYNNGPVGVLGIWLSIITGLSIFRWIFSKVIITKEYFRTHYRASLSLFLILTCFMGTMWGASYFIFLPYVSSTYETLIMLVLGGMSAGAIASLSIYLPAYYLYVIPMFVPIIIYNFYLLQPEKAILAVMYTMFVVMVLVTARINAHLLQITMKLNKEKDVLINEMTLTNLKLEKSISEVHTLSITDSLTGLFNRRYFDMIFNKELGRAKRNNHRISLVFIDIDNFKYINDTFGHPCGDDFLIYVANTLKSSIQRSSDTVFRLGGDEFAAILANINPNDVVRYSSFIQELFNRSNQYKNVTLSMGIISISALNSSDHQSIITAADRTLYQAKKAGKNIIISKEMS